MYIIVPRSGAGDENYDVISLNRKDSVYPDVEIATDLPMGEAIRLVNYLNGGDGLPYQQDPNALAPRGALTNVSNHQWHSTMAERYP